MMYQMKSYYSRAATAENPLAEQGAGGMKQNGKKGAPCLEDFKAGETRTLLDAAGPGIVRHMWLTIKPGQQKLLCNLILRMYWDGQDTPSVEVPLASFFGIPYGIQKDMQSNLFSIQGGRGFNCYVQMPFRSHARITVENDSGEFLDVMFYQIDFTLGDEIPGDAGYFHAQYRRSNPCPMGTDYTVLDGVKGRGVYLGTVIGVRSLYNESWWGEGEVKIYLDGDREYPTICGTGLEDYFGFAWGMSEGFYQHQGCTLMDETQAFYSMYRHHTPDPIYFQDSIRVAVQQMGFGPRDQVEKFYGDKAACYKAAALEIESGLCYYDRTDDYCSTALWYQTLPTAPFPVLPGREERLKDLPADTAEAKRSDI